MLLMIIRNHPLIPVMWLGLLAFMTYLFVDAINTSTIGYAAMPIGFLFGKIESSIKTFVVMENSSDGW